MNPEFEIAHIDLVLSFLREAWIDADDKNKSKWMIKINAALDDRLVAMRLRDAKITQ